MLLNPTNIARVNLVMVKFFYYLGGVTVARRVVSLSLSFSLISTQILWKGG